MSFKNRIIYYCIESGTAQKRKRKAIKLKTTEELSEPD
ncbi:hypothetical protein M573_121026 [Prevotella intermedia ZT]|uniref:Uncharacterized protein n=1 Tax=Prevotella intermedia ZT TaxID=1347790 RepID=A0AAP0YVV0_PREIN|nr:hypothetical protein M573_121026 [Prevotella intermedia ZT]